MNKQVTDIAIIGCGMVGLAIAHQLKQKNPNISIEIIDKENQIGLHSSGRNSGILHAGIYYPPNSLKAKVCINGAKRLKQWCQKKGLDILECGKVITPQDPKFDDQLDVLLNRGIKNGAEVYLINEQEFYSKVPYGRTSTGRALWSPNTCVVKPMEILKALASDLQRDNVRFNLGYKISNIEVKKKYLRLDNNDISQKKTIELHYGHLFNTAGLHADRVAKSFDVGDNLTLLPFKGLYWKLDSNAPINFQTNLYPVPDLDLPFLGIHISPNLDGNTYLGPTAIPAWGRENYYDFNGIEPLMAMNFLGHISRQLWKDSNGFRRYAIEQGIQGIKPFFLQAAQKLAPSLKSEHLIECKKVGIRPQLYDQAQGKLIQDFLVREGVSSTHVLNAISPAFTASFALADLILENSNFGASK